MPVATPVSPSTTPDAPSAKPPSKPPLPGQRHHSPPRTIPTSSPGKAPLPQPKPSGPGIVVAVAIITSLISCHIGVDMNKRRKRDYATREKGIINPNPKRRRPCRGSGKPTVTYEDRKRKIGRFYIAKTKAKFTLGGGMERKIKEETNRIAKEAGYNDSSSGEDVKISSELDFARTLKERALKLITGEDVCFYQVYSHEKRRICRCPDGSPCRSTVVRDS